MVSLSSPSSPKFLLLNPAMHITHKIVKHMLKSFSTLHKKWTFSLKISSVKIPADLVTFTEGILNRELHFLSSGICCKIFEREIFLRFGTVSGLKKKSIDWKYLQQFRNFWKVQCKGLDRPVWILFWKRH